MIPPLRIPLWNLHQNLVLHHRQLLEISLPAIVNKRNHHTHSREGVPMMPPPLRMEKLMKIAIGSMLKNHRLHLLEEGMTIRTMIIIVVITTTNVMMIDQDDDMMIGLIGADAVPAPNNDELMMHSVLYKIYIFYRLFFFAISLSPSNVLRARSEDISNIFTSLSFNE